MQFKKYDWDWFLIFGILTYDTYKYKSMFAVATIWGLGFQSIFIVDHWIFLPGDTVLVFPTATHMSEVATTIDWQKLEF